MIMQPNPNEWPNDPPAQDFINWGHIPDDYEALNEPPRSYADEERDLIDEEVQEDRAYGYGPKRDPQDILDVPNWDATT